MERRKGIWREEGSWYVKEGEKQVFANATV